MLSPVPSPITSDWLAQAAEAVLARGVALSRQRRIGEGFGLAGEVYELEFEDGSALALKLEAQRDTEQAVGFLEVLGPSRAVPGLLGSAATSDRGILVTELIDPAEQGDVLEGCTPARAAAVLRSLAEVHAATWDQDMPADYAAAVWEEERWRSRIEGAARRLPQIMTPQRAAWLQGEFRERLAGAIERLEASPRAGIQVDAHLDNVLWRPDGSAVLVDWSRGCSGPPAVDLAGLMVGGLGTRSLHPYREELLRRGIPPGPVEEILDTVSDALLPLAQGFTGWAGREDLPEPEPGSRAEQMRSRGLATVLGLVGAPLR